MEQIEVFRTTVATPAQVAWLTGQLQLLLPACRITFDLDDCDKVLRIAGHSIQPASICICLHRAGFACSPLA